MVTFSRACAYVFDYLGLLLEIRDGIILWYYRFGKIKILVRKNVRFGEVGRTKGGGVGVEAGVLIVVGLYVVVCSGLFVARLEFFWCLGGDCREVR